MPLTAPSLHDLRAHKGSIARYQAVLFDLDGTLYNQAGLRAAMLCKLSLYIATHPAGGWRTLRILSSYRKAQEQMRCDTSESGDLGQRQLELASEWSGADGRSVSRCVRQWMEEHPAQLLMRYRMPLLPEFLCELKARGVKTAVCSDYPATAKLEALGVLPWIDSVNSAQDAGILRFKPHPRLLEAALDALGVAPWDAVYFGDRPDVDGIAAQRAGVAFVPVSATSGFKPFLEMSTR